MGILLLDEARYLDTMGSQMKNVTENAAPLVNIWGYARQLMEKQLLSGYAFSKRLVEAVYENSESTYQHILLFAEEKNRYIVIVVDMVRKAILGHYILDLNKAYGLQSAKKE